MQQKRVALVTAGLAGWLVLTAAGQLPDHRFDALLQRGRWRIPVPNWRFFGPNPGVTNTHLLYRDFCANRPSIWRDLEVGEDRPWYGLVWNPRNRAPKSIFDASQRTIVAISSHDTGQRVTDTSDYIFLSRYVQRHAPHEPGASETQFLLVESKALDTSNEQITPAFASERLPLPEFSER
ncbi:hypothetical protein [Streptomyces sp. NRRL B-1347]|uniref:hypothetical protein n=1 Tax=Streptomyces sp. NRRL B-1347 TaxID=1476877 RepID=UPI00131C9CAF|nr:hypothetical protein [Streptomyces sp. NRRL B-1347]